MAKVNKKFWIEALRWILTAILGALGGAASSTF